MDQDTGSRKEWVRELVIVLLEDDDDKYKTAKALISSDVNDATAKVMPIKNDKDQRCGRQQRVCHEGARPFIGLADRNEGIEDIA